jgi:hypothetical protein
MAAADFERFHDLVVHDGALRARLRSEDNVSAFVRAVVTEGRERGFNFSPDDVEAALLAARRQWRERW